VLVQPLENMIGSLEGFVRRMLFKGIVHFEVNFWYVLAYLKGIQDVGVFVSTVFSFFLDF